LCCTVPAESAANSSGRWSARIFVSAGDAAHAVFEGRDIVVGAAFKTGLPTEPVVRAEAVREDVFDEDLARPQLPDLMSGPEVAERLSVSLSRVHQLAADGRLKPAIERPHATLWFRAQVEKFDAEWDRKPGRRRDSSAA
jgi:hypothetical protein